MMEEDELRNASASFSDRVMVRRVAALSRVAEECDDLDYYRKVSHRGRPYSRKTSCDSSRMYSSYCGGEVDGNIELKIDEDGEEYYEKTVFVKEEVQMERIKRVDVNTVVEEVKLVPRIIEVPKIVEVPEIVCKEVCTYKDVEVPEIVEQVVYREIEVPQYVEVEVPEIVEKEVIVDVRFKKPKGVELIYKQNIEVPSLLIDIEEVYVPLYVPVIIEVPIPIEQINHITYEELIALRKEIEVKLKGGPASVEGATAESPAAPTLSDYEKLGIKISLLNSATDLIIGSNELRSQWASICRDGCTKTRPYQTVDEEEDQR